MSNVCSLKSINKSYSNKSIIKDFSLNIDSGEMVAIMGKSGIGKTTLLNIIGLLERVDGGKVELFGEDVTKANRKEINNLLRNKISYLFQNCALIDNETIEQNLDVALVNSKKKKGEKKVAKEESLKSVGLNLGVKHKVYELSGGEQQKLAIARILLKPSELILADEPTGSLDSVARDEILDILKTINEGGATVIIVTHDKEVANQCKRIVSL